MNQNEKIEPHDLETLERHFCGAMAIDDASDLTVPSNLQWDGFATPSLNGFASPSMNGFATPSLNGFAVPSLNGFA